MPRGLDFDIWAFKLASRQAIRPASQIFELLILSFELTSLQAVKPASQIFKI